MGGGCDSGKQGLAALRPGEALATEQALTPERGSALVESTVTDPPKTQGERRLVMPYPGAAMGGGGMEDAWAVEVLVSMHASASKAGNSRRFGLGLRKTLGEGLVDTGAVHEGVLGPEETLRLTVEVPQDAVRVWVRTQEPGFAAFKTHVKLKPGVRQVKLQMRVKPGATARGRVVAADGKPAGSGRAELTPTGGQSLGWFVHADGRFEAHYRGEGPASLAFDGYDQGTALQELPALDAVSGPQDLLVRLVHGAELGGTLVSASGRPLPGMRLLVVNGEECARLEGMGSRSSNKRFPLGSGGRTGGACQTGPDGRFEVVDMAPGNYSVLGIKDGESRWSNLSDELLSTGRDDHQLKLAARRVRVRLALPEGGFAPFEPLRESALSSSDSKFVVRPSDGLLVPPNSGLRVSIGPAHPDVSLGFNDFGGEPGPRWYSTGDPACWEVWAPLGKHLVHGASPTRPAAWKEVTISAHIDYLDCVIQLEDLCEPGVLALSVANPARGPSYPGYRLRLIRGMGPDLFVGDYLSHPKEVGSEGGATRMEVPPGTYTVMVQPDWESASRSQNSMLPEPLASVVTVVAGALSELHFAPQQRTGLDFFHYGRPNDQPLRFFRLPAGHEVHPVAAKPDLMSNSNWAQGEEAYLFDPGQYRVRGMLDNKLRSLDFDLTPGDLAHIGWWKGDSGEWHLTEAQFTLR